MQVFRFSIPGHRFAYVKANIFERIFINLKIIFSKTGVRKVDSIGSYAWKSQYIIVARTHQ